MKLYYHEGSWQLPGQQDKSAARVDVPGSPAELAAWLNARRVSIEAGELLARKRAELELQEPGEGEFWKLGPPTKNPPRVAPAFLGDLEAQAEFVPVTKAAEIDRLLQRCPACHTRDAAALERLVFEWARNADPLQLDNLSDIVEERRK